MHEWLGNDSSREDALAFLESDSGERLSREAPYLALGVQPIHINKHVPIGNPSLHFFH